eukprot:jgi/Mesen1/1045/ME000122S00038
MDGTMFKSRSMPSPSSTGVWEDSYRPLPSLFLGLLIIWTTALLMWVWNTWSKRLWQASCLQWALTSVPLLKAIVLGLSFAFWYSCLHVSTCSFWVAFGVFVSRIFFETACFISLLLISHGYCITHEQLSLSARRSIAGLASLLYLALTGYKAAVPHFSVLVGAVYVVLLFVVLSHTASNVGRLQEQLQAISDEGAHLMHNAVYTKYCMFRKFQGTLIAMVLIEIMMHTRAEGMASEYWIRLLLREWAEIAIFCYIGWTFRSKVVTPFSSVMPSTCSERALPPIHRVEMNAKDYRNLNFKEWHIGVAMPSDSGNSRGAPILVVVQNPGQAESPQARLSKPSSAVLDQPSTVQVQHIPLFNTSLAVAPTHSVSNHTSSMSSPSNASFGSNISSITLGSNSISSTTCVHRPDDASCGIFLRGSLWQPFRSVQSNPSSSGPVITPDKSK